MLSVKTLRQLAGHGISRAGVACGVFDGVHRGHQHVIQRLVSWCGDHDATPVVLTFDPHPRAVLTPDDAPPLLTLPNQKLNLLAEFGVAAAIVIDFNRTVADLPPEEFLATYLLNQDVCLAALCVGSDWRFGRDGTGDTAFLKAAGHRHTFNVFPVEEVCLNGVEVGSRAIRQALQAGDLDTATAQLGREYVLAGRVREGKGMGEDLFHCPTANIIPAGQMLPADGVYAIIAHLNHPLDVVSGFSAESAIPGVAYVGTSPTVTPGNETRVLETHLFDFDASIYGKPLAVRFVHRVRGDRTFTSLADLAEQMRADIATAKTLLAKTIPHHEGHEDHEGKTVK
ncbi:MAG: riboflavin biosynthesis protein RibF [Lentisphaeria bacterium]|nr:riboflavin biosynthesis protein RibF [Lentisphaeria bacterium]